MESIFCFRTFPCPPPCNVFSRPLGPLRNPNSFSTFWSAVLFSVFFSVPAPPQAGPLCSCVWLSSLLNGVVDRGLVDGRATQAFPNHTPEELFLYLVADGLYLVVFAAFFRFLLTFMFLGSVSVEAFFHFPCGCFICFNCLLASCRDSRFCLCPNGFSRWINHRFPSQKVFCPDFWRV